MGARLEQKARQLAAVSHLNRRVAGYSLPVPEQPDTHIALRVPHGPLKHPDSSLI